MTKLTHYMCAYFFKDKNTYNIQTAIAKKQPWKDEP